MLKRLLSRDIQRRWLKLMGTFRPLDPEPRAVLAALLAEPFPGQVELVAQLAVAEGYPVDRDGCYTLRAPEGPSAPVLHRVPVEGFYPESDGVNLHVLLHVVDGYMSEMEVFREDNRPPIDRIDPRSLRLLTLPAT